MSRPKCPCGRSNCAVYRAGYQHPQAPPSPLPGVVSRITVQDGDSIIITVQPTLYPGGPVSPSPFRRPLIVKIPKRLARIIAATMTEE